ncbi:MAG: RNA polymerase factor sigma-54 [Deltaproteobacteria bacterium]|nr:RNA polymerase factor sigma-54 [Deltaproteobacteria bacterium]
MAFELKQSLKLTQQLLMTPQLQQAIKLLQLSRQELEQFVATQVAENPCLEEDVTESPEEAAQVERERERTEEQVISESIQQAGSLVDSTGNDNDSSELDWDALNRYQEQAPASATAAKKMADEELPNYENIISKVGTLQEYLLAQIGELDFDDQELKIASFLIGNIDDRGYLTIALEELAEAESLDLEQVEGILDTIQRLDPNGVGARDLKECLHLQLRNSHLKNGVVEAIVENHLRELENRNFTAIAKAMQISLEEVLDNVHIIADLEPVPGRQFGANEAQYITPDVYVFKLGNEWVVNLNEDGLPKLRVSDFYSTMMSDKKSKGDDKNYVAEKMKAAEWLIKSIRQRQRTIFRVTESIVKRQLDFFESGVEYLKPMILKDVAEDISMHESTISRVTNNKYVHTPRGVFELKYFFNSSVSRADGQDMASESVKRMISDLVKVEDARKPLSDQRIVEILEERGIQLARRTVAKYREQLQILPSSKRKKYF